MTTFVSARADWRDVKDATKRRISVSELLRNDLRVKFRGRRRADCPLCKGNQAGTLSYNDREWFCFRCNTGGDAIRLIELTHGCSFKSALAFLADHAGVQLPTATTLEERRRLRKEWVARRKCEAELDHACAEIEQQERALRIECVRSIRQCDRVLISPAPWDERQWQRARAAHVLCDEFLMPEFLLLAFAAMPTRLQYLLNDARERAATLAAVRWAGGVTTDDDHFVEVVT